MADEKSETKETKKKQTYSEETIKNIVSSLKNGQKAKDIGTRLGIAATVVRRLARKEGFYISKQPKKEKAEAKTPPETK